MIDYQKSEFAALELYCSQLEQKNKILRERLHNSKRDNRTNRDRLRGEKERLNKELEITNKSLELLKRLLR